MGDDAGTPGCLSGGPTPAATPEMQRVTSAQSDEGAAVSDSGSHGPEDDVRAGGAASVEGKRDVEHRPMATLRAALEGVGLSAPKEPFPPRNSKDVERRQKESDEDLSRQEKRAKVKSPLTVDISVDPQQDATTGDKSEEFVNRDEKTAATEDDNDHTDEDYGIDGGIAIGLAPPMSTKALDIGAAVDEASGHDRSQSRQKNVVNEEKGQGKTRDDEDVKEGAMEGLDKVSEKMLGTVNSEDSKEMEGIGAQQASGERRVDAEKEEIISKYVRGEERKPKAYASTAAASDGARIATTATTAGGSGNDSVLDTLRQSTEIPEVIGQAQGHDSASKSPLSSERSTLASEMRVIGYTDDKIIAETALPEPEDKGTAAKASASSPPPLPTPATPVLAPARSVSPSSLQPEVGASSSSSLAGLPLPPVSGGRPRFGLLGSLPPVGGRGLPSLALRSGAGIDEAKRVADSSDATRVSDSGRSDHNNSAPRPPPPGVFGSPSARTAESLSPSDDAPPSSVAPRSYTASTDFTRSSSILDDSPTVSRHEGASGREVALGRSDANGDDVEGSTSKAAARPGSPRQHQGQEEEDAGVGSTGGARGLDRVTADDGKKAQGEGGAGDREGSGGYFGDSGEEVSEEEIPEEVSRGDDDISFEQDSSDSGAGAGGDDDYFS